jgi:hypothetical protein
MSKDKEPARKDTAGETNPDLQGQSIPGPTNTADVEDTDETPIHTDDMKRDDVE